jgi:surface antigen
LAGDGAVFGTGIGAAVGGLLGSQIGKGSGQVAATALGVATGAVIGNSIGHSVDDADRMSYSGGYGGGSYGSYDMFEPTYEDYTPNYVAPPAPPPTYMNNGSYCREFSQQIMVAGHLQESYGTACLQPDGTWRIVQ